MKKLSMETKIDIQLVISILLVFLLYAIILCFIYKLGG